MYVPEDHVHEWVYTGRNTSKQVPIYNCTCGEQQIRLLERRPGNRAKDAHLGITPIRR